MGNQREYSLDEYNRYIKQFESSGGDHTALNKKSGAYGAYQHLPSTTRKAAKALGKSVEYLKTPEGQEEAQNWLLTENKAELGRRGIPATPGNMYGIHQQGGQVFAKMYNGDPLSDKEKALIVSNTPAAFRTGDAVSDWNKKYGGNVVPYKSDTQPMTPFAPTEQAVPIAQQIKFADAKAKADIAARMEEALTSDYGLPLGDVPNPSMPADSGPASPTAIQQLGTQRLGTESLRGLGSVLARR